jgi:chromate reductase, NAD(P)H dehydrogenase (quinone)
MRSEQDIISVTGLIGSLRKDSFNRLLFENAQQLAPEGMTLSEQAIGSLPHYNEDLESILPESIVRLRNDVSLSDAILIVTPEYNFSIPGVLKNAIDWLSKPTGKSALNRKPVAIMGASSGRSGTMRAQIHLRGILSGLNMDLVGKPDVFLPYSVDKFDERGAITEEFTAESISGLLTALQTLVIERRLIESSKMVA